ncbi:hypothetical protein JR316_0007287 [Psilocybe cubensis]|nr:hypothetical protein JR316_0007287 [Psilocybe cubensis]KAH9480687.1 hypothetical protein JR316_0007287 [Psilocybe cubensis]
MRFISSLVACACIVGAAAQRSFLGGPPEGTTIHPGKHFTVQLIRPNSIEGSTEVGLVIGLLSCAAHPAGCPTPDTQLGSILFNGDFKPTIHEIAGQPYENFTVTVPSGFPSGIAQLSTARFHLIGAGPSPILEFNNVTLNVV